MFKFNVAGVLLAASVAVPSSLPAPVHAQSDYPSRPIRVVIPYAPGGNVDFSSRALGAKMSPLLGQQIVLENKAGADGAIGSAEVARSKPDGYTLLVGTSGSHVISPITQQAPMFDPVKDLTPIAVYGVAPNALAVNPSVAQSLPELISKAKANPGKYSYGSSGLGGLANLSGELFKRRAGKLDIVHVPYKGGGQTIVDLVAGQIPMAVLGFSEALTQYRAGKVRILAVFNDRRSNAAPEIPTAIEQGVPDMIGVAFNVLLAPAATPKPVVDRLYQSMAKVMEDKSFQKQLADFGIEPVTDSNPEKAAQFIRNEIAKWTPLVKASGISSS